MWLMHVETRQLEEFYNNIPPYAILSHTWGVEEVSFQDLNIEGHKGKHGYAKIDGCCRQAQKHGLAYVWVDTCCIDKSSSAELSEAINSMYRWYEMAKCCYVYLEDVTPGEDPYDPSSTFRRSRWLERGWTLQMLIAPSRLEFFDANWNRLFIISSHAHAGASEPVELLSTLTAIPVCVLLNEVSLASISVACKFSWAARRRTTRSEDMAYCLMGLLQVNMPLLYGEGDQAFVRLQEVVLGRSDDITALLWGYQLSLSPFLDPRAFAKVGTVLARTPAAFINYPRSNTRNIRHAPNTHTMTTENGLQVDIPMICVDRTRAIWLGLVIEDLSRTYTRDPEAMHGIAIVLEENANRSQRAIGCPPVRIRHFGHKRMWYQRGRTVLHTIYLQDNVAHTTYFTFEDATRRDLRQRIHSFRSFRDYIKPRKYPNHSGLQSDDIRPGSAASENRTCHLVRRATHQMDDGTDGQLQKQRHDHSGQFRIRNWLEKRTAHGRSDTQGHKNKKAYKYPMIPGEELRNERFYQTEEEYTERRIQGVASSAPSIRSLDSNGEGPSTPPAVLTRHAITPVRQLDNLKTTEDAYCSPKPESRSERTETLGTQWYETLQYELPVTDTSRTSPAWSADKSDNPSFSISLKQLREKGYSLHSVYPPLQSGHYFRYGKVPVYQRTWVQDSDRFLELPEIECQESAGEIFTYMFSNDRGSCLRLKLELKWRGHRLRSCDMKLAVCGEHETALEHHPQFASNPMIYRHERSSYWEVDSKIIDIPSTPFYVRGGGVEVRVTKNNRHTVQVTDLFVTHGSEGQ